MAVYSHLITWISYMPIGKLCLYSICVCDSIFSYSIFCSYHNSSICILMFNTDVKRGGISINLSVYIHNVYFNMLKFLTNSPFTSCYCHICAIEPLFTSWNNAIINACFAYDYSDPLNIITCFSQ